MLILKLAFRNLMRHSRKTLVIGSLIAIGMAVLFFADAVFESTNSGLRSSFVNSLTGDVVISALADTDFGLFGSEVPIVSEYESIPALAQYADLAAVLGADASVRAWSPIVSALAQLRVGGIAVNAAVFGVDAESYFTVCPDIVIERGEAAALAAGGVFINAVMATSLEASLGRPLSPGEDIVFGMYSGGSFRLKKGSFAGVHRYVGSTEALDRVVLADPTIVRSMANYTLGYARPEASPEPAEASQDFDIDSLFSGAGDIEPAESEGLTLADVEASLADTGARDALVMTDSAAWSFVLIRAAEGRDAVARASLSRSLAAAGLECRVMNWRDAVGTNAQALFALQAAFYVGLGFVALGAVLVIMNALVISVLERTSEIGTMRGLGAGVSFIRRMFIVESMSLTLLSAFTGVLLGVVFSYAVSRNGIALTNPLLVSLFGGSLIRPVPRLSGVFLHLALAIGIGALAWIYPVSLAMRIQPVAAMSKG